MRDILYKKLSNYKLVHLNSNATLEDLETLGEGTFVISDFPKVSLVKQFPLIFNSTGEVALDYIEGILFLTISKDANLKFPGELQGYISNGASQFSLHSHPALNVFSRFPSIDDIKFYSNNKFYIIDDLGLLEVETKDLKKMVNIDDKLQKFMDNAIYDNSSINYFYEDFYADLGIKLKRYQSEKEIQDVIKESICKKIDFWDRQIEEVKFPGKTK